MENLQKKYGFWTATAMVVGIVIGSGVFFKADDVLKASGGSLPTALLAWLIGGMIMVVTAYVFSKIATRVERVNGVVDYFEQAYGHKAGYLVAWFMTFIYYPTLVAVLAWVSANYTVGLLDMEQALWPIAWIYLTGFFMLNYYSPVLAGKWQVTSTVVKLIPLALVAVVGSIAGLTSGQTLENFTHAARTVSSGGGLAVATLSTAFAYEGWIIATVINAELKDAKRTLPRALVVGTLAVVVIYMVYYLGISGVLTNEQVLTEGNAAPVQVIALIFSRLSGTLLTVFVIISCLGTLNGLIMGAARGMYSIASRNMGPNPEFFCRINPKNNCTTNSALIGYVLSCMWLVVWYGNFAGWWGQFMDISELPIAFLYVIYISIYIWVMKTFTDLGGFSRFACPALAGIGSVYIIWGAIQKDMFTHFLLISLVIIGLGVALMHNGNRRRPTR
ncbi:MULTISPECIES: APC family permease [unclassified Pseudodesulfovibrio]|uniref:APC family permease n=1 Tax=unclassified Pseudodesulfovibrio TaxID=2661612 RepID=UPI000FEC1401|nr:MULTISPECIES: APC family permease [unclassified Pseudodesulfovibrio]MCJ2165822.1 APC family permease [Pseudodesulfovibrio sp. S3-i]RWU02748.1 APC family permease [Pseudodesulfovibrio sp. S3]